MNFDVNATITSSFAKLKYCNAILLVSVCHFLHSIFCREERENWIHSKYELKEFLESLPKSHMSLGQVFSFPIFTSVLYLLHSLNASV